MKNFIFIVLLTLLILIFGTEIESKTEVDIISIETYELIEELNTMGPYNFFCESVKLSYQDKINDIAFLQIVGLHRLMYVQYRNDVVLDNQYDRINDCTPEEQEYYNEYYSKNTEELKKVYHLALKWIDNNDYVFYPRKNDPKAYQIATKQLIGKLKNIDDYYKWYRSSK